MIGGNEMKGKKLKTIISKIDFKKARPFILLTVIFTVLGLSFGKALDTFLVRTDDSKEVVEVKNDETNPASDSQEEKEASKDGDKKDKKEEKVAENKIFIMQHGVYETYDNVLNLAGELKQIGYNYGILKVDGKYSVFSYIGGTKDSLAPVKEQLTEKIIDSFIKEVEVPLDDLKWNYFVQAVKQRPYEMDAEFIQTFTDDEMHIWGYYVTLATSSFEANSPERQKMLLEIYQWLNG